jgi:hypothetical protein
MKVPGVVSVDPVSGRSARHVTLREFIREQGDHDCWRTSIVPVFSRWPPRSLTVTRRDRGDHDQATGVQPCLRSLRGVTEALHASAAAVIRASRAGGYDSRHAVEIPLTSLSDDAERTQKAGQAGRRAGLTRRSFLRRSGHHGGRRPAACRSRRGSSLGQPRAVRHPAERSTRDLREH